MTSDQSYSADLSADQFQFLIEQTSDVITVVDEKGTIKYQSPSSTHVKGWAPEELHGADITEYIHPDDRERVVSQFQRLVEESGYIDTEIEFRFRSKDRGWIWIAATGTAADGKHGLDGYITASRDITDRKETEEELKTERDRLALLNQIVRHDIRNDMSVILGWAAQLEENIDKQSKDTLDRIIAAAQHTMELTESVRDITELLGSDNPDLEPIDLIEVIEDEIAQVQSDFAGHSKPLKITGDKQFPNELHVQASPLLRSVFGNLLHNAVYHNDKESVEIEISIEEESDLINIRVADNGPGISDERKREIFGRGEKGLESSGSGLGLYLVDSLVSTFGGSVWVEDNEPEGAVFVIELLKAKME